MPFVHGKRSTFKVQDAGSVMRDLSPFTTEVTFPRDTDLAETSAFGNSYKTYMPGLADSKITIRGQFDGTASTGPDACLSSLIGAIVGAPFEYMPDGITAVGPGNPKFTGSVFLQTYELTSSIGDVVKFSASFQLSTSVTRAVA